MISGRNPCLLKPVCPFPTISHKFRIGGSSGVDSDFIKLPQVTKNNNYTVIRRILGITFKKWFYYT